MSTLVLALFLLGRAVGVTIQCLQLLPNLSFLNAIRGFVKMWCRAFSAFPMVLTSALARIAIMPKPICTTLLIGLQILYV